MAHPREPVAPPESGAAIFKPYIPPQEQPAEFTPKAIVLGALFGLIFGAVTVYLALRAGLTVSASIPIAVLAIAVFKKLGRSTILENNIVQTAGSAGESVAAGVVFTIPALIFLGFPEYFTVSRIFLVALVGGILGVLFMIPMRRYLIVKEHGNLLYPEGTACADVLVAGERGGSFAGKVFWGLGIGAVYKFAMEGLQFWKDTPTFQPRWYPGGTLAGNITPEYLGVGYIIGPRIAGTIFAGGVLSWLVLLPAIKFFGAGLPSPLFPGTIPIAEMQPAQMWSSYIRPIGAGAVATAGLFTLARTIPTIIESFRAGARDLLASREQGASDSRLRTERDLPITLVLAGSAVLVVVIWSLLQFNINSGFLVGNALASILMVIFGFLFVTVSSRIVGIIGSSANPISGMTIATLMATSLIFLLVGWTAGAFPAVALSIGAVVCIAAANAGATSQDLKTGFLVGATPWRQQVALVVGVLASVIVIGWTLTYLNRAETRVREVPVQVNARDLPEAKRVGSIDYEGRQWEMLTVLGSRQIEPGTYYADPETGAIRYQHVHGIGSQRLPAPQALLMSTVINGILSQNLPWGLVLLGMFIVVVVELMGVRSLAFAVGAYLPIATTAAIFGGGVVRWLVDRKAKPANATPVAHGEGEVGSGPLFSSGLIAAGALVGLLVIAPIRASEADETFAVGRRMLGPLAESDLFGLVAFVALAAILYYFACKPLEEK